MRPTAACRAWLRALLGWTLDPRGHLIVLVYAAIELSDVLPRLVMAAATLLEGMPTR